MIFLSFRMAYALVAAGNLEQVPSDGVVLSIGETTKLMERVAQMPEIADQIESDPKGAADRLRRMSRGYWPQLHGRFIFGPWQEQFGDSRLVFNQEGVSEKTHRVIMLRIDLFGRTMVGGCPIPKDQPFTLDDVCGCMAHMIRELTDRDPENNPEGLATEIMKMDFMRRKRELETAGKRAH